MGQSRVDPNEQLVLQNLALEVLGPKVMCLRADQLRTTVSMVAH